MRCDELRRDLVDQLVFDRVLHQQVLVEQGAGHYAISYFTLDEPPLTLKAEPLLTPDQASRFRLYDLGPLPGTEGQRFVAMVQSRADDQETMNELGDVIVDSLETT